jgi:hypothetical protein
LNKSCLLTVYPSQFACFSIMLIPVLQPLPSPSVSSSSSVLFSSNTSNSHFSLPSYDHIKPHVIWQGPTSFPTTLSKPDGFPDLYKSSSHIETGLMAFPQTYCVHVLWLTLLLPMLHLHEHQLYQDPNHLSQTASAMTLRLHGLDAENI